LTLKTDVPSSKTRILSIRCIFHIAQYKARTYNVLSRAN
jgi:hypothetical protein